MSLGSPKAATCNCSCRTALTWEKKRRIANSQSSTSCGFTRLCSLYLAVMAPLRGIFFSKIRVSAAWSEVLSVQCTITWFSTTSHELCSASRSPSCCNRRRDALPINAPPVTDLAVCQRGSSARLMPLLAGQSKFGATPYMSPLGMDNLNPYGFDHQCT